MDTIVKMMIEYLGKANVSDIFECQICGNKSREKYLATPEIVSLANWEELLACKKCARREIGTKNVKKWNKIHEKKPNS